MPGEAFFVVSAGLFGAVFGSFLNVCIVRLPADESVIRPRSKCPTCGTMIAWYDNIPVLSWVILRARCRGCGSRISALYPLIEAAVAAIWAAAAWYYGITLDGLAAAVLGTILLGIGVTDGRTYIIPDEYTIVGLPAGLLLSLRGGWDGLLEALLGALVGFGLLLGVAWAGGKVFKKEAMGGGDIKMMATVGAFLGWQGVVLTLFGGALLGSLVFLPLALLGSKRLVPFGVFLAAAAAVAFVFGDAVVGWYLGFTGLG